MEFYAIHAHLNLFAVQPGYQRRGIGRQLLEWLEASARTAGIFKVYLEVRATNGGALAFYEKLGYRWVGRKPAYYDAAGLSLKRFFLASPLKFEPRVTSGFSYRRLHPVLGIRRPHLGADFGAPRGAPGDVFRLHGGPPTSTPGQPGPLRIRPLRASRSGAIGVPRRDPRKRGDREGALERRRASWSACCMFVPHSKSQLISGSSSGFTSRATRPKDTRPK